MLKEELLTDFEAQDMEETLIPANVHMSNQEGLPSTLLTIVYSSKLIVSKDISSFSAQKYLRR